MLSSRRTGAAMPELAEGKFPGRRTSRADYVLNDRFRVLQRQACRWGCRTQHSAADSSGDGDWRAKLRRRIQELASRHIYWGRRLVY